MRSQKSRATAFRLVAVLAAAFTAAGAHAQSGRQEERPYTTWRTYGGGGHSSQYSALDQINKSNVTQLTVAWSFPVGERSFVFNPVVVDNVMYVLARENEIVALDAATGRELWAHPHEGPVTARGINYWQSADGSDRRLLYLNAGMLTALNARTGQTITTFGKEGRVDLRDGLGAGG
ncbi:MAG: pyrroloquinoline quinone-dependent dehydrogenase, partial [Lysobacterales bacterium]